MSLVDINKSNYLFEPDIENKSILYSFKALSGINGEIIQEIIDNRPYTSLEDFMSKIKCNKTQMVSLIKSGAFDYFGERKDVMQEYIWKICEPKKRITLQNFNGLNERDLIPQELDFEKRLFVFNQALRKYCKLEQYYVLRDNFYDFYEQFFDIDLIQIYDGFTCINQDTWKKLYTKGMDKARDYFKAHQEELLEQLNKTLFQEMWTKYAKGSYSDWEMESLGFYFHEHPLINVSHDKYGISTYKDLSETPPVQYTFKKNNVDIPIFRTTRIVGTVIAKDDMRSQISLLTSDSGVVTVKFTRDYYARLNKRISELQQDGTKKVKEEGWFKKGTKLLVNGFRREDTFVAKSYKNKKSNGSHQCYKINDIRDNEIEMTWQRYGE